MTWLPIPFAALAGLCWLSALVHWLLSLGHLSGRTSLGAMLFKGFEAFNGENYTPQGRIYQRRFGYSAAGFFVAVLLAAVAAVIPSLG